MKKALCLLVAVAVVVLGPLSAYAVTTSGPISVSAAIVAGTPDMTVVIHRMPKGDWNLINWNETLTAMTFDKFTVASRTVGGNPISQWTSVDIFAAFVYADGYGAKYQITSSGTGHFLNGTNPQLPDGSFVCTPVYSPNDQFKYPDGTVVAQGDMPSGATLGSPEKALMANKSVYKSESPAGSAHIIQTIYSFPPYNANGTPPIASGYDYIRSSQANGTYTGVTVTVNIAPY